MKKLVILLALFTMLIAVPVSAADQWYKGNHADLAWDAVTTYEDGTPIDPATELGPVTYKVYIKNDKSGVEIEIGTTTETVFTAVLPARGWYRFGVQAWLGADYSTISWSTNPAVCQNQLTFGVRFLFPNYPVNMRNASNFN